MLKQLRCCLVALMFWCSWAVLAHASDLGFRPKLGCVPFLATSLQAMAFTENISASLLNNIDKDGYFEIVERRKIEQVLELEGVRLDNLNQASIARIGAKAGLDYVVHGNVSTTETGAILDVNLLNVRSKKTLMKESFRMSESDFSRKVPEISATIVERVKNANILSSEQASAVVQNQIVLPPKSIAARGSTNSIRLSWTCDDQKQVAGFNIYRSNSVNGPFNLHATTTTTLFTDETLKLNEVFYYRIATVSQSGVSSEMTIPVKGETSIAPPAPIFMNVEADIKGASLSWRPRPGTGTDPRTAPHGYKIYRYQGETGAHTLVTSLPLETTSWADSGLADGVKYVYMLTSYNRDGAESEFSARLSIIPLSPPASIKALSGRIRSIPLSWGRYTGSIAKGYVVYRSDSQNGHYGEIARLEGLTRMTYVDVLPADNTTYWYRLSVYKSEGLETDLSEPVSAVTRDIPPTPRSFTAISGEPRKITLRWKLAGTPEDEIKKVIIYRMMSEKGGSLQKLEDVSGDRNEFVDERPPLQDKTTYYYRICALNSGGAKSLLSEQSVATTKAPPTAPFKPAAVSGAVKKVLLHWDANSEPDIREYQIFRKRLHESEFKLIREQSGNNYEDAGLEDGSDYSYRIRAIDRDGLISSYSETVTARTKSLPLKIAGVRVSDARTRTLTWQPNREKDVVGYIVYKKGFLGVSQKLTFVKTPTWKLDDPKGKYEIYMTAVDETGLESEPSDTVAFE